MSNEISPSNNVLYFPNNIDIRICPKNGMSTLKEALRRTLEVRGTYGHKKRASLVEELSEQFSLPFRKNSYRIAVRRDPIDRFKSACEFIQQQRSFFIQNGKFLPKIENQLDSIIESMSDGSLKNNHFYTQSWYMGIPSDYDMVYHIDELPKLLAFLQITCHNKRNISSLHENKTELKLYNDAISPKHLDMLRQFYMKDFNNGWCKQEDYITI